MARNTRRSNGMKKLQPAELNLLFRLPNLITGVERPTIDLSQCASLANRRFYRQGLQWMVAGFTLHTNSLNEGTVTISKLPSTWIMSNAWEKSFRAWKKMNDDALDETSVRPRFLDFKIYANSAHHELGFGENLVPIAFDTVGAQITADTGMWEPSKVIIPRTDSTTGVPAPRELIAVGASYPGAGASGLNAVSLIEGYANSRALPNVLDPNTPDDASDASGVAPENWMSALFNEGTEQTEDVIADLQSDNNIAPYPFENDGTNLDTMYPGGANQLGALVFHDRFNTTSTTVSGKITAKGGAFPCGLIQLNYAPEMTQALLQVHLVPGDHRGYMATPMTEM